MAIRDTEAHFYELPFLIRYMRWGYKLLVNNNIVIYESETQEPSCYTEVEKSGHIKAGELNLTPGEYISRPFGVLHPKIRTVKTWEDAYEV